MRALLNDLGLGLWRLVPSNPILVRVVFAGGRRVQHLWIRTAYLSVLALVVMGGVLFQRTTGAQSLSELAKSATNVFEIVSILQLGMVCVLAPIFAAGAITQERDSQTYNILLSTPLSNAQIVLGSLLSRLYFVVVLLVSGVPLFCIMMVYGGVTGAEIALACGLSAATAAVTASVAIAISVIRIGTGRTIFSFYLMIALYLMALWSLAQLPALAPAESPPAPGGGPSMSWLAAFHPFLSLWVALNKTPAPDIASVAHYGFPRAQWLAWPHYSFIVMSLLASAILVTLSVAFVRRSAKAGEVTWWGRWLGREGPSPASGGEVARRPRHVWSNPVAWREAVTKAAAGSGGLFRLALMAAGLFAAVALLVIYLRGMALTDVRLWLKGLVGVELGLALFIATATAATSMTREKEANTLDLLLATPLQSRQIIFGKLLGLVTFAAPMLAVPVVTLALFIAVDLVSGRMFRDPGPVLPAENLLSLPLVMVSFTALACLIGLRTSIQQRRTVASVLVAVGLVVFVFAITSSCSLAARGTNEWATVVVTPLSPLASVMLGIDPRGYLTQGMSVPSDAALRGYRVAAAVCSLFAAIVYGAIGWAMLNEMVKNFDRVIRKQTA